MTATARERAGRLLALLIVSGALVVVVGIAVGSVPGFIAVLVASTAAAAWSSRRERERWR